ncbi:hypothetical protein [Streptomyces sp. NBC_01727]|uniref:hypothetical protein n=1 Tax=Streptomyces sp. NBC_01727 TaxID=2975924 RepID=UPI002E0EA530|nr:hypothetical protein OIE76_00050 [Streptomyces sp. NBC_01727]WSG85632.1 hypothetical protein OIE76_40280 [Streptomyces sp. NBC_01727]
MTSSAPSPQPVDDPPRNPGYGPPLATAASENDSATPDLAPTAQPRLASAEDAARTEEAEHRDPSTESYWTAQANQHVGINRGVIIGTLIEQGIRRLRGTTLTRKDVDAHLRTYVRDQNDDFAISKILADGPVAVLIGANGSGRLSTALDVLRRRVGDTIRQVRREPGTPFALDGLHEHKTGWILDLRAESPPAGFGRELAEDAHKLPPGSLLAVLIGTAAWEECGQGAAHLSRLLAGPLRCDILRKHLERAPLVIGSDRWIEAEPIQQGIADLQPSQIQAWANAIVNTEDVERDKGRLTPARSTDDTYFTSLVQNVVKAAEDWRSDLLEWHTAHQDSDYRNYLLAAAVLEGASSKKIYEASTTLAKALKETPQSRPGQQGLGVVALTQKANADLQPDGRIRFRYHNYAEAVVDYFLDDRPHLLQEFTRWTAAQVTGLDEDRAEPLAQRVSHWVVHYTARHRRTGLLKSLAEQWSTTNSDAACDLLVLAAVDDRTGELARNAYRRWTKPEAGPHSADFTAVLIRACRRLAEAYPSSMLGRIAELAAGVYHDGDAKDGRTAHVTQAVSEALNALWDDSEQRSGIHRQLTQWAGDPHAPHRAAAQSTFAHLAQRRTPNGPALLTNPSLDTAWLTDIWRNALPTTGWSPPVADAFAYWMQTALDHPEQRQTIEQIMRDTVHRAADPHYSANRLIAMQNLLYSWAPAPPAPQTIAATHLREQILTGLRAQDPAAPPLSGTYARQP